MLDFVPDLKMEIENLNKEITDKQMQLEKWKKDREILIELYDRVYIDAEDNILK